MNSLLFYRLVYTVSLYIFSIFCPVLYVVCSDALCANILSIRLFYDALQHMLSFKSPILSAKNVPEASTFWQAKNLVEKSSVYNTRYSAQYQINTQAH